MTPLRKRGTLVRNVCQRDEYEPTTGFAAPAFQLAPRPLPRASPSARSLRPSPGGVQSAGMILDKLAVLRTATIVLASASPRRKEILCVTLSLPGYLSEFSLTHTLCETYSLSLDSLPHPLPLSLASKLTCCTANPACQPENIRIPRRRGRLTPTAPNRHH